MSDGIEQRINVLHEALSSHLLIASVIEGDYENLTLHQTIPISNDARFCPLHYMSPSLCEKIRTNPVRLPLALPQKWELHHLKIQEW